MLYVLDTLVVGRWHGGEPTSFAGRLGWNSWHLTMADEKMAATEEGFLFIETSYVCTEIPILDRSFIACSS